MLVCHLPHACCLLVARLAAVWSTLPPPVVSPSPVLRHAPAGEAGHATLPPVMPTRPPGQLKYSHGNPVTRPDTTLVVRDSGQRESVRQKEASHNLHVTKRKKDHLNTLRLVKDEEERDATATTLLGGKLDLGGKRETDDVVALTVAQNDSRQPSHDLSYDTDPYFPENDTSYGGSADIYYMYDNVSDIALGNSSDVFKIHYKIYQFQMIKVGVLCTVMSIIILSTCKMLLQVLAQYAGREKPPDM
ncbi:uncharacterized protein [Panulirus ornatus]|uniref:uncharacterized protein n=1 Tax=Panulirus ornatus TaxID=150431 RepID=UPI003A8BA935